MNISSYLNIFLVCTAAIVASTPNLHCNAASLRVADMEELALAYTETDKLDYTGEPYGHQYPSKDSSYDNGMNPEDEDTSEDSSGDDTGASFVTSTRSNDIIDETEVETAYSGVPDNQEPVSADEDLNLVQTAGGRFECPRVRCLHGSKIVCSHRRKCNRRGHCFKVKACCPTCISPPTFCPSVYDPVCCNGKTYSNQCHAGNRHCHRGRCH